MKKKTVHVVTHTHWDREWYGTFQEFRLRLVDLMDHTFEIFENDGEFKYFTLDGQTVVLEDYLDIKPEKRTVIEKLVREGKMLIGPWYVLVDEFLVSGEALIRNLLIGHRISSDFGAVMKDGYLPDMFGHISQMPQILSGFDIDTAVVWRGLRGNPVRSEYYWEAPDGTKVLTHHLPEPGYAMVVNLPDDIDKTEEVFRKWYNTLLKRSDSNHLLVLNGVDHLEPQPILTKLIRGLNDQFGDAEFIHSTLGEYFRELRRQNLTLPTIKGELKSGYDHAAILVDILSARMYLKLLNDVAQRSLESYAEPLNALSVLLGGDDYSAVIRQGWKYVIRNHPHDTIGGCSIDEVHQDMIHRFRWANQISEDISERSLRTLAVSCPDDYEGDRDFRLLVFNSTQYPYTGTVEAEVFIPNEYGLQNPEITDYSGTRVPLVVRSCEEHRGTLPQFRNNPHWAKGKTFALEFFVESLPPVGYRRYRLREGRTVQKPEIKSRNISPVIENGCLKATVLSNGTLTVKVKGSGKTLKGLHYFEDGGDAGDEYNFGKPVKDKVVTTRGTKARILRKETTGFCQKVLVGYTMKVPSALGEDRQRRGRETVDLDILSEFKLVKGSKRIDVTSIVSNHANDHRLRVVFPSGKNCTAYHADSKFDVVKRPVRVPAKKKTYAETPTGIKPHDSFVDVSDRSGGLAIITRGTPEHEVIDAKNRPIAITLIRSVGWLSRADGPYRRGNAGPDFEAPEAQGHGVYTFNYSIYPHDGTWESAAAFRQGLEANTPPSAFLTNRFSHGLWREFPHRRENMPNEMGLLTVDPDYFVLTAMKRAEDETGLVVRICNLGTKKRTGRIRCAWKPRKVWKVNLGERVLAEIRPSQEIRIELRSKEICTLKIRL
jgi:mannosylglycerate hydrolase